MISEHIPKNFTSQLEVVGCYVEYDGRILLLQRHQEHTHSSKWGLPAGKLEKEESPEQAVIREVNEETGLIIEKNELVYREVLFVNHEGKEFLFHTFQTKFDEEPIVKINPLEHKQHGWFTVQQALTLDYIHDLDGCLQRHYGKAVAST